MERWVVTVLPDDIKDYKPRNIFNVDETGLYWRAIPEGTLEFKKSEAAGSKVPKERVTLLLACNMDGSEKLEPLVIGKSKKPRCFKNVKRQRISYEANKNVWHLEGVAEKDRRADECKEAQDCHALRQLCRPPTQQTFSSTTSVLFTSRQTLRRWLRMLVRYQMIQPICSAEIPDTDNQSLGTANCQSLKVKANIALHGNPISELRDVTCHMGSLR